MSGRTSSPSWTAPHHRPRWGREPSASKKKKSCWGNLAPARIHLQTVLRCPPAHPATNGGQGLSEPWRSGQELLAWHRLFASATGWLRLACLVSLTKAIPSHQCSHPPSGLSTCGWTKQLELLIPKPLGNGDSFQKVLSLRSGTVQEPVLFQTRSSSDQGIALVLPSVASHPVFTKVDCGWWVNLKDGSDQKPAKPGWAGHCSADGSKDATDAQAD